MNENPMDTAKLFLQRYFRMANPQIERAHRDGPKMADKPRHFLIKMLNYQDKQYVMTQQRNLLAETELFVLDDLTKKDREEKRKWRKQVQEAYQKGVKYHFAGGRWRDRKGNVAPFCAREPNPRAEPEAESEADSEAAPETQPEAQPEAQPEESIQSRDPPPLVPIRLLNELS